MFFICCALESASNMPMALSSATTRTTESVKSKADGNLRGLSDFTSNFGMKARIFFASATVFLRTDSGRPVK